MYDSRLLLVCHEKALVFNVPLSFGVWVRICLIFLVLSTVGISGLVVTWLVFIPIV